MWDSKSTAVVSPWRKLSTLSLLGLIVEFKVAVLLFCVILTSPESFLLITIASGTCTNFSPRPPRELGNRVGISGIGSVSSKMRWNFILLVDIAVLR